MNPSNPSLDVALDTALSSRDTLFARLHEERTDAYRLLHGINEGRPGLTVDRYGDLILTQAFYEPLPEADQKTIRERVNARFNEPLHFVFNDRSGRGPLHRSIQVPPDSVKEDSKPRTCRELGIRYAMRGRHAGQDPLLFLDMRAGRRYVKAHAKGKSMLNLFAYTCGVGICAAASGADVVWNVDFAASSLAFGRESAALNALSSEKVHFIHEDVLPVLRQLAGLPVKGRGAKKRTFKKFEPRGFDFVYLDPPRWAKTPFGAIDVIRDYPSLFKPALLATREGGRVFCTNHEPKVAIDDWLDVLQRCADKAGRPLSGIEVVTPEEDFPSHDGKHPLKMAAIHV